MGVPNGEDDAGKVRATDGTLARILRLARIREAKDANAEVKKRSQEIERARQRRARSKRDRGRGST